MLNESDPYVQLKLKMLKHAMPAETAVVFGDMWRVDGGYTCKCLEYGCKQALLVDTLETPRWQETRIQQPNLEFYKGDFSNALFMQSIVRTFDIGVVYDVLLHQAPLLHTLNLMLSKVNKRISIVQPMLREQGFPNSLIYLPGNTSKELHPLRAQPHEARTFAVDQVNHSHWLWGMTVSFLTSALRGEGFDVVHQASLEVDSLTEQWTMWGCVAERRSRNPLHWSNAQPTAGLYQADW